MKRLLFPVLIFTLALTACGGKTPSAPAAPLITEDPAIEVAQPSTTSFPILSPTLTRTAVPAPTWTPPPNLIPVNYYVRIGTALYQLGYSPAAPNIYMPTTSIPSLWQGSTVQLEVRTGSGTNVDITNPAGPKGAVSDFYNNYGGKPGYDIVMANVNTPAKVTTEIELTIMVGGRPVKIKVPLLSKGFMPTPQPSGGGNNGGGNGIPTPPPQGTQTPGT